MVRPIVKLDNKAVAQEVLNASGTQELLESIATEIASADSNYRVESHSQRTRFGSEREVKRVVDSSDGAFYKEANTGRMAKALKSAKRS